MVAEGYVEMKDLPGLGPEDFNDEVLAEHANPDRPELWTSTDEWNDEYSNDRLWS